MEQNTLIASLQSTLGGSLPGILGALAILALGWFAAVLVRAGSRRILRVAGINQKLQSGTGQAFDLESMLSLGLFGLVLLITVVAVLNILDLESLSSPFAALLAQITTYLPHLLAGAILSVLAWVLAT
ncbi:MAG: hypothetical protein CVU25_04285, partial [Betaproteobacteria bacterium HGW-Betaproteobacteria-19]